MTTATWDTITGNQNVLVLAPRPGDESRLCGGLIAEGCRRGRPPFVVVLTDAADRSLEQEIRGAVRLLGLPAGRLLLAGLSYEALPGRGPAFQAIVHGITMVMWARDCNVICAPAPAEDDGDRTAAHRIARAVAKGSGVGLLSAAPAGGLAFDAGGGLEAKRAALRAYRDAAPVARTEHFVPGGAPD